MTVKEYLSRAYRAQQFIATKERQLSDLRQMADGIGGIDYGKDRVTSTHASDARVVAFIDKIMRLEHVITTEKESYLTTVQEIRQAINAVENPNYRLILENRYLNHLTWEQIAEVMFISDRHVRRLHVKALDAVETKISKIA